MSLINLTFAGDFYFAPLLNEGDPDQIIAKSVQKIFKDSDYSAINFEAPVCEPKNDRKIVKTGPHLHNPKKSIDTLKYMNINLACLANNHILDYGEYGIQETLKLCNENGIQTIGAGKNLVDASKILNITVNGKKIALINVTENEWSIATNASAGANPYDIVNIVYKIQEAKKNADVTIIIIHGGHEFYTLPSPRMKKVYRFFVDSGADAVVGHHTHCFSGYEVYKSAPIFYSLGNFLFPLARKAQDHWYEGIIATLIINEENIVDFKVHPYVQCKDKFNVELMPETESESFFKSCSQKTSIIKDDDALQKEWMNFIKQNSKYYYSIFTTSNVFRFPIIQKILYRLRLKRIFLNDAYLKNLINGIQCEAHYDMSVTYLNKYLKQEI